MSVTKIVKEFYNETPFPNYDLKRFETKESLRSSAYPFAEILNRSIPKEASIIDVGTGTGQLSAYLSLDRENVFGIDFSDSSLNKARSLKEKLKLNSLHLRKVNIMDLKQIIRIGQKFDYVLCLGVLHHTEDAYKGFKNILHLLKPGGYIAVGLYNKFGRIPLKFRKFFVNTFFKESEKIKERIIKIQITELKDKERFKGWFNDQYLHPHETTHTIGEVLRWFKKNNVEFFQTVPSSALFSNQNLISSGVWNKENYPYFPVGLIKQLSWIYKTQHEGGYFITFGKNEM